MGAAAPRRPSGPEPHGGAWGLQLQSGGLQPGGLLHRAPRPAGLSPGWPGGAGAALSQAFTGKAVRRLQALEWALARAWSQQLFESSFH
eukprot:1859415-Lingulodinium_polyedra.AAC.1